MNVNFLKLFLTILSVVAFVSCAVTSTTSDQFRIYQKNIQLKDNPEALKIAEQALINIVEDPYAAVDTKESVQQILASSYITGEFGYLSEENFRYWFNREGERLGEYYVRINKKIASFYESYQKNPSAVNSNYAEAYTFCDQNKKDLLGTSNLDQVQDNKAFYYLSVTDCVKLVISESVKAQRITSEYFAHTGINSDDEQRSIGFNIVADGKFKLNQLTADQYEPVAQALSQIVSYSDRKLLSCNGKVPGSVVAMSNANFDLARSGNLKDREKAYSSLETVMTDSKYSDMDKVCVLFFVTMGAAVAEDIDKFYDGAQKLLTYETLIMGENRNYIIDAGLRFLIKHERFSTAIEFFNASGFPMPAH